MSQVKEAAAKSPLVKNCMGDPSLALMYSVQFLATMNRGPLEVEPGDWIIVGTSGLHVIGMVAEMVQCFVPGRSSVHLRLTNDWRVTREDSSRGGVITVDKLQPFLSGDGSLGLVIDAAQCSMIELFAGERDTQYVFEYVF